MACKDVNVFARLEVPQSDCMILPCCQQLRTRLTELTALQTFVAAKDFDSNLQMECELLTPSRPASFCAPIPLMYRTSKIYNFRAHLCPCVMCFQRRSEVYIWAVFVGCNGWGTETANISRSRSALSFFYSIFFACLNLYLTN